MTRTVIDELIVTLGLDPDDFKKGQKEAAAAVVQTKDSVKRANQEMGQDFAAMAKKFLSFAAAVALIKKLVGALAEVSTETRRLGFDSQNFNLAASRLRNMQNAVEMLGGKAEDVTRSVEGLQKAVYDLTVMGQSSASLEMLTRLGVQFQDATGHARDYQSIMEDTADALERAQKNGTFNHTEAFFAAQQAGFDEGSARLILQGRDAIHRELAQQQGRHQVNAGDLSATERIERTRINVAQGLTAEGVAGLGKGTAMYDGAVTHATNALEGLASAANHAAGWWGNFGARGQTTSQRERTFRGTVQESAHKAGVPYNILHGLIMQESRFDPDARSKRGAVGIAQFMPSTAADLGFTAGVNPKEDIMQSGRYLRSLYDIAKRRARPGEDPWSLALQYYNAGTGRVAKSRQPGGAPLTQEAVDYPGLVMGFANQAQPTPSTGSAANGGATTVYVGPITVNTQATDADGIAQDMNRAVQNKMSAAQAEPGMR